MENFLSFLYIITKTKSYKKKQVEKTWIKLDINKNEKDKIEAI